MKQVLLSSPFPRQENSERQRDFPRMTLLEVALLLLLSHFSRALCDPIDGSPSGSPVPGILQERTLEWVAISFANT